MKAFIINNPQDFEFCEIPVPACGASEVLIRVLTVGICGSDVEIMNGDRPRTHVHYPIVPGHEWVGRVVRVGRDIQDLRVEQLVVVEGIIHCGQCANCLKGATNLCLSSYDEIGFTRNGAFSEFVVAPRRLVHAVTLASGVQLRELPLVEPSACAVNAGMLAAIEAGQTVAVVGGGTVGLLVLQYAALHRPGRLVMFDKDPSRLFLAKELGATESASAESAAAYAGMFDVVIEAAGSPRAVECSFALARKGGRVVLLGIAGQNRMCEVASDIFVLNGLQVFGVFSYTSKAFRTAAELISQGKIRGAPLIDREVPFEETARAIKAVGRGNLARPKIIVNME